MPSAIDSLLKKLGFWPDKLHQRPLDPRIPNIAANTYENVIVLEPSANPSYTNTSLSARISQGEGSLAWTRQLLTVKDQERVIDQGTLLQHNRTTGK